MHSAPPGSSLFQTGDPCAHFAALAAGTVRVSAVAPSGREILLYRVRPREVCAITMSCLLGGAPYPADGVAQDSVNALLVPRPLSLQLYDELPTFRIACHRLFSSRLADLMSLLGRVAFGTTAHRLAALLSQRGPCVEATHERLAAELGTSREVVSRALKQLERAGLVLAHRGWVEVVDTAGLLRHVAGAW